MSLNATMYVNPDINPCGKLDYKSKEYDSCVKDIVYENAQEDWIMLDPRFPNLKGITPNKIDNLIQSFAEESLEMKEYCIDYLNHVMVYDRDDVFKMCLKLGEQIEKQYPGKLHDSHTIFITTPRGGFEVLSIFAYANNITKEQIPSHIKSISEEENISNKKTLQEHIDSKRSKTDIYEVNSSVKHFVENNYQIIPDIWLNIETSYLMNKIETVFIIDDIIASGQQMTQAYTKVSEFFGDNVKVIPVVLCKRKDIEESYGVLSSTIYNTETVGIGRWNASQNLINLSKQGWMTPKPELIEDYDGIITVRFPWGSPDGMSDAILIKLYEGRIGLDRIERKQRKCILNPSKCELK